MTTKAIGGALGITPKTAGNHIERIYQKIGVSTRAEAAMFAMRHGLATRLGRRAMRELLMAGRMGLWDGRLT